MAETRSEFIVEIIVPGCGLVCSMELARHKSKYKKLATTGALRGEERQLDITARSGSDCVTDRFGGVPKAQQGSAAK